jgi:hypothetical protein
MPQDFAITFLKQQGLGARNGLGGALLKCVLKARNERELKDKQGNNRTIKKRRNHK